MPEARADLRQSLALQHLPAFSLPSPSFNGSISGPTTELEMQHACYSYSCSSCSTRFVVGFLLSISIITHAESKCVDAPSFVWAAEIFPTTLRAKGLSLAIFSYFVGTITFTAPAAVAFENMSVSLHALSPPTQCCRTNIS